MTTSPDYKKAFEMTVPESTKTAEESLEQPWMKWWYGVVSSRVETVIWPVMLAGNQGRHHSARDTGVDLGIPKARLQQTNK